MPSPSIAILFSYINAEKEIPRALDPWYKRPEVSAIAAVDGIYKTPQSPEMKKQNYPDYSTDNSEHVLKTRYPDKITHDKFLGSQMEKRQRCMDIAGELGCDFAIVWDSDDYLHPDYQNWDKFFKQLEMTKYWDDQVFKMWAWIPSVKLWSRQHNAVPSNYWMPYARIHKNPGEQRYVSNHYTFTKKSITDEELNEWDYQHPTDPGLAPIQNPLVLQANIIMDGIRFTTDRAFRSNDQLTFGDGWAWQNMHEENWRHTIVPAVKKAGLRIPYENEEYYFNEKGERIVYLKKDKQAITPLAIKDGQIVTE